ncbi:MAG: hypothetical protein IPJ45_08825 [Ignavibacteria bacterium]|nr:hypothetical protein [Ignavibacteria bacterium]
MNVVTEENLLLLSEEGLSIFLTKYLYLSGVSFMKSLSISSDFRSPE